MNRGLYIRRDVKKEEKAKKKAAASWRAWECNFKTVL